MTDILFEWGLILCDTTSLENGKQLLSYKEYSVYRERHLVQKKKNSGFLLPLWLIYIMANGKAERTLSFTLTTAYQPSVVKKKTATL